MANAIWKNNKDKLVLTNENQILLGMKTANICLLSYRSTAVDGNKLNHIEEEALELLNIIDYKTWTYTIKQEKSVLGYSFGSLACTGLVSNVSKSIDGPIPFICFRGTYTIHDMVIKLLSKL